jgi:hypothetical protein
MLSPNLGLLITVLIIYAPDSICKLDSGTELITVLKYTVTETYLPYCIIGLKDFERYFPLSASTKSYLWPDNVFVIVFRNLWIAH